MLFVFIRKNPSVEMSSSTSAGSAFASAFAFLYFSNSAGVALFTFTSVVCAESTVATMS